MTTPMTVGQFEGLTALETALRAVFLDQLRAGENDSLLPVLFNVQESRRAAERNMGVGGFGDVPEYTGALEYDGFEPLYTASYQHKEYALGMAVQRALLDDDEYNVIRRNTAMLGLSFDRTVEKHAASVFNNAFSTDVLGADGKPLCATDHPLRPSSTATGSNKGTSALSDSAVIDTKAAMMKFTDSRGNLLPVMPDTLLVPVELEADARIIVESTYQSGGSSNNANVNAGYKVVVSRYLTDPTNWFMVDSRMAKLYLNWYWRVRPEFTADANSAYGLVYKFRGYGRWSFGWDTWQFIYGHEVEESS